MLLDEPTAGMDLSARRALWEMLKNHKRDKIIILTTHYMDEADVLGDRIGIMARGKIICLGSSLFLKNLYGTGYKLTCVKANKEPNREIQDFISERLGKVEFLGEVASEISFILPVEASGNFKDFFSDFDEALERLNILSYGISMTSLEEVFLKSNEQLHEIKVQNVDEVVQAGNELENSVPEEDKEVPKDTLNLVGKGTLC